MSVDLSSEPIMDTGTQHFCVEVMKRLDIERKNGQFCDLILEVGSGDEKARLKAHRNILSAASPFFYKALNSDMKEKLEGVIRLEETSKAIMEGVLDYIYTGYVSVSEDNVYEVFAKADYFDLPALKSFASNFIVENLSLSNCVVAHYFASKYQWEQLMKGTRGYIQSNFLSVAETDDFLDLSCEQVKEWISSDEIIVPAEENVFEVVLRWSERDESRKRDNFRDLFRYIRFVHMSRDYLFQVILSHPLVRDNVECSSVALNAMKSAFDGTEESLFSQSPRNCLKTHEDVIVACGERRVLCYLPADKVWYELPEMKNRYSSPHHSVSVCHGKLYVMGKDPDSATYYNREVKTVNVMERFDPSLNLWNEVNIPDKVFYSSAAVTVQGFLYVVGGKGRGQYGLCTVQKYNPDTNQWDEVSSLSSPRSDVCAVTDGSNYLYAIGGTDQRKQYLNIVERFDPRKNTWEKLPPMLARRSNAGGAAVKQRLFVFGGLHQDSKDDNDSCEMFDPATDMWSSIPSQFMRRQPTSAVSFKGKIYVCCTHGHGVNESERFQVYDVNQNQWEPFMPVFSSYHELLKLSCLRVSKNALSKCRKVPK